MQGQHGIIDSNDCQVHYKEMSVKFLINIFIVFFSIQKLSAQVLFEGYSKITLGGTFIGFTVQRYEFDTKKRSFVSTSLIKYNEMGGSITESLKAYSNEALEPINYSYNYLDKKTSKTIEGTLVKEKTKTKLKLKITEGGKTQEKEKVLPKGAFLSSFLAYVILKNPQGLKKATEYKYEAVAEEDGEIYQGVATVQSEETLKGLHVYKVLNKFKGAEFISFTTDKGEMISTTAKQNELNLELKPDAASAMGDLSVSADNLKLLFGSIPEGKINALASSVVSTSTSTKNGESEEKISPPQAEVELQPSTDSIKKKNAIKGLELQTPPDPKKPGKKGTRKNLQIQTKEE